MPVRRRWASPVPLPSSDPQIDKRGSVAPKSALERRELSQRAAESGLLVAHLEVGDGHRERAQRRDHERAAGPQPPAPAERTPSHRQHHGRGTERVRAGIERHRRLPHDGGGEQRRGRDAVIGSGRRATPRSASHHAGRGGDADARVRGGVQAHHSTPIRTGRTRTRPRSSRRPRPSGSRSDRRGSRIPPTWRSRAATRC